MVEVILAVVGAVVFFAAGVLVGAHNAPSVDKAITAIDTAEKSAAATLATIGAHKATTAAPTTPAA